MVKVLTLWGFLGYNNQIEMLRELKSLQLINRAANLRNPKKPPVQQHCERA